MWFSTKLVENCMILGRERLNSWWLNCIEKMHSHIGGICLTFLHCEFSNVSSGCLPENRQSHIGCIWLTFLHCAFSNVQSSWRDSNSGTTIPASNFTPHFGNHNRRESAAEKIYNMIPSLSLFAPSLWLLYLHAKCIFVFHTSLCLCSVNSYCCTPQSPAQFVVVIATGKLLNLVCLDSAQKLLCGILPAGWHHDAILLYHRGTTQTMMP